MLLLIVLLFSGANSELNIIPEFEISEPAGCPWKFQSLCEKVSRIGKFCTIEDNLGSEKAHHSLGKELLEMEENLSLKCQAAVDLFKNLQLYTVDAMNTLEDEVSTLGTLLKKSIQPKNIPCPDDFYSVAGSCLYFEFNQLMTWEEARVHCATMNADLATPKKLNQFQEMRKFLKTFGKGEHFWIGGSDIKEEDNWIWIDGDRMPKSGPPYWGKSHTGGYQPKGGRSENCGIMDPDDYYFIHDYPCSDGRSPLCQFNSYF